MFDVLALTMTDVEGETINETAAAGGALNPPARQAQTKPKDRHLGQQTKHKSPFRNRSVDHFPTRRLMTADIVRRRERCIDPRQSVGTGAGGGRPASRGSTVSHSLDSQGRLAILKMPFAT